MQPGWQVAIRATPLARPLVEAVTELIARLGAYPILQLSFEQIGGPFAREAPIDVLARPAPLLEQLWRGVDAFISIWGPREHPRRIGALGRAHGRPPADDRADA